MQITDLFPQDPIISRLKDLTFVVVLRLIYRLNNIFVIKFKECAPCALN